ncbi:MAG: methionine adenosyltransferase, partial [Selenomonadaceae bacterium]|nr:methionine adenosyltransferase [Selenomonadaceae bacterium]
MRRILFTSESVTEGHPDKVADRISDSILDAIIEKDPLGRVACETLVTTGQVHVVGEISTTCYVDIPKIIRGAIEDIGYTNSKYGFEADTVGVLVSLDEQSPDIAQGVNKALEAREGDMAIEDAIGAGDQGMMFGYATNETDNYMPLTLDLAHTLVYTLARIRKEGKQMLYLRPDSKSQVTIEYDEQNRPVRIDTIVLSTQHDEVTGDGLQVTGEMIKKDIIDILLPRVATRDSRYGHLLHAFLEDKNAKLLVNPTGKFVIGGPHGDTGLTG